MCPISFSHLDSSASCVERGKGNRDAARQSEEKRFGGTIIVAASSRTTATREHFASRHGSFPEARYGSVLRSTTALAMAPIYCTIVKCNTVGRSVCPASTSGYRHHSLRPTYVVRGGRRTVKHVSQCLAERGESWFTPDPDSAIQIGDNSIGQSLSTKPRGLGLVRIHLP